MLGLRKAIRFLRIYGPMRTLYKVIGRTRIALPLVWRRHPAPDIAMVGCGQFAFATIGYFISRRFGARFRWCFDIQQASAKSFRKAFRVSEIAQCSSDWLTDRDTRIVYIASNHYSHTDYACAALSGGKDVYLEKPIAVTWAQLVQLDRAVRLGPGTIYSGYNRPFSRAIRSLKEKMPISPDAGFSICCFVSGHLIAADNWYRHPLEGTRICGNAGHWIDLFLHILNWRDLPAIYRISLISADPNEADDNFSLSIATDKGDIFSLMLTARSEPFEGVNETLNLQHGSTICKIDDFRTMSLWRGHKLQKERFWPKDVGHRTAILQPFDQTGARDWGEVVQSTILMLHIRDMILKGEKDSMLSMPDFAMGLDNWVAKL